MNDTDRREERSKAFTRRTVVWGIAAYIAMALSMDVPAGDGTTWFLFLVLPSFIAGLFVAVLLSEGAFIKLSDCRAYNLNQVRIFLEDIKRGE